MVDCECMCRRSDRNVERHARLHEGSKVSKMPTAD